MHFVGGLKRGESYRFRVSARNEHGFGPPSAFSNVIAGESPRQPGQPEYVDIGSTSIHLKWTAPNDPETGTPPVLANAITGYMLFAFPGAAPNTVAEPNPVKAEVQQVELTCGQPMGEVQILEVSNSSAGSFVLSRFEPGEGIGTDGGGIFRTQVLDASSLDSDVQAALRLGCSQFADLCDVTVS